MIDQANLQSHTRLQLTACIALTVLSAVASAQAQTTPPASTKPASQGTGVRITARNEDGAPAELSPSDLRVKIDGEEVAISAVRRLNLPLTYCLILDTSGSQRDTFKIEQHEAIALLSKIPKAGRDYGLLVTFDKQAYLEAEGDDPQKLAKAILKESPWGATALYDAMVGCSDRLSKNSPDALAIFVFSDGEDNSSQFNRDATERALVTAGVNVYSIGKKDTDNPTPGGAGRGIKALKHVAEVTGGKSYVPKKDEDLEKTIADISGELASLSSVTLTSTLQGDRLYKLEVRCNKKGVSINAARQLFVPLP